MSKLHLDSLSIKQFRSFRDLEIPRFGQVNLLTGKNGIGKSAILEALRLYADSGSLRMLRQLISDRDEFYRLQIQRDESQDSTLESDLVESVRNLFFGRPELYRTGPFQFEIGPLGEPSATLVVTALPLAEDTGSDRIRRYHPLTQLTLISSQDVINGESTFVEQIPGMVTEIGSTIEQIFPLNQLSPERMGRPDFRVVTSRFPAIYVPVQGLNTRDIGTFWEKITLTDLETQIKNALNAVSPETIEGITVLGRGARAIVKTARYDQPFPLRSMGEGLVRAFGLALALVSARNGLLLVDEIDSGLHHSVQYEIWKMIFQVAQRLNIQVFATTHSWDAVESFQQAAAGNTDAEGMLIRLERSGDEIVPTLFDEARLAIVTRAQIEVR